MMSVFGSLSNSKGCMKGHTLAIEGQFLDGGFATGRVGVLNRIAPV
jgi:hypothetical protein